ncbi:MAG: DUF5665 domain-containing protein [Thermovirgaceae bacterium]
MSGKPSEPKEDPMSLEKKISEILEDHRCYEFVEMMESPWKLLWRNFLIGVARGLGFAIGLTVLTVIAGYIIVELLKPLLSLQLPVIGGLIADVIQSVQNQMNGAMQ